jgi:ArsR family transcriptional regulator
VKRSPVLRPWDARIERAVELLSMMAHPVRLAVLSRLLDEGASSVGDLMDTLEVEQSALSHHLSHLRAARLVTAERDGRRVIYRLHDRHVATLVNDALAHAREGAHARGR